MCNDTAQQTTAAWTGLVNRQFVASDINQLWVTDMTYIPTRRGFVYLAVATDVFSRKVVG